MALQETKKQYAYQVRSRLHKLHNVGFIIDFLIDEFKFRSTLILLSGKKNMNLDELTIYKTHEKCFVWLHTSLCSFTFSSRRTLTCTQLAKEEKREA